MDLPIYSDRTPGGENPFPALEHIGDGDVARCLERFERLLDHGEGASNPGAALAGIESPTKQSLLRLHRTLFESCSGAGVLRASTILGPFQGQDCPEPEFLDHSLDSFERWLTSESVAQLHPIQQAGLALTRLVDLWPFDFGNLTTAVVFANSFLLKAGYPPFFVRTDQVDEFNEILSRAVRMETEPLVRAIYRCLERELRHVR